METIQLTDLSFESHCVLEPEMKRNRGCLQELMEKTGRRRRKGGNGGMGMLPRGVQEGARMSLGG